MRDRLPELDDQPYDLGKLASCSPVGEVRSLTVVHMEVPCCTDLVRLAQTAIAASGRNVPLEDVVVSIRGRVVTR